MTKPNQFYLKIVKKHQINEKRSKILNIYKGFVHFLPFVFLLFMHFTRIHVYVSRIPEVNKGTLPNLAKLGILALDIGFKSQTLFKISEKSVTKKKNTKIVLDSAQNNKKEKEDDTTTNLLLFT